MTTSSSSSSTGAAASTGSTGPLAPWVRAPRCWCARMTFTTTRHVFGFRHHQRAGSEPDYAGPLRLPGPQLRLRTGSSGAGIPPSAVASPAAFKALVAELEKLVLSKRLLKSRSDAYFRIVLLKLLLTCFPLEPSAQPRDVPSWLRWVALEMMKPENFIEGLPAMWRLVGQERGTPLPCLPEVPPLFADRVRQRAEPRARGEGHPPTDEKIITSRRLRLRQPELLLPPVQAAVRAHAPGTARAA